MEVSCTPETLDPGPTLVVLLDATTSTKESESSSDTSSLSGPRDGYIADFEREILPWCGAELCDLRLVRVSSSRSRTASERVDFYPPVEEDDLESWLMESERLARDKAREFLSGQSGTDLQGDAAGNCTDLLSAFDIAAAMIGGSDRSASRLVAFTDGLSSCDPNLVDMARSNQWPGAASAVEMLGDIPDFHGARTWMPGFARGREEHPLSKSALDRLREFWTLYFETGRATVEPDAFSPRLDGFGES